MTTIQVLADIHSSIDAASFMLFGVGLYLFIAGRLFLIVIISRGSWTAAAICLVIPFLEVGFIWKHFSEARLGAMLWAVGLAMIAAAYGLILVYC